MEDCESEPVDEVGEEPGDREDFEIGGSDARSLLTDSGSTSGSSFASRIRNFWEIFRTSKIKLRVDI